MRYLFTSESVTEGHPDKLCDIISDAILDECVKEDPLSRVACECCTKAGMVMIFGEITTSAIINYEQVIRETLKEIGYDDVVKGLDYKTCSVIVSLQEQSPDIAQSVGLNTMNPENICAGDQGIMFGYATDETNSLMPLTHTLATALSAKLAEVRKTGLLAWMRPDGKTQVTCEYEVTDGRPIPVRVHTVVVSAQHTEYMSIETIRADLLKHVVKTVIPDKYLDKNTIYHLNPSGRFTIGGPAGDAGLTGRKIMIDSYGSWGAHGGGAFSGKDATKVDRSAAYAARWVAKSLVAAKLCHRCLVQLSYAIGVSHPLAVFVDSYGTGLRLSGKSDEQLTEIVNKNFDLRPGYIIRDLDLRRPVMKKTAAYGHFGRSDPDFTWEIPKEIIWKQALLLQETERESKN